MNYRDQTFDFLYVSSSSSFFRNNLTNENVTSQFFTSTSTSHKQSLISFVVKSTFVFNFFVRAKLFQRFTTSVTLNDLYLIRYFMINIDYSCTAFITSSAFQELNNILAMRINDSIFFEKLQIDLSSEKVNSTKVSSFLNYDELNVITQSLLRREFMSINSIYFINQFTNSLRSERFFSYQVANSIETYSLTKHNLMTLQTVILCQTTSQINQFDYTISQTSSRVLRENFISSIKISFENSLEKQLRDFFENVTNNDDDVMLQSLEFSQTVTKSEYIDDQSSFYNKSTDQSSCSNDQSFITRRRSYKKRDANSRSTVLSRKQK